MDSFEVNKIIAAVLLVALIVIGLGKLSDVVFHVKKPEKAAYKVLVTENTSSQNSGENKKEEKIDISALLAMGSVEHGEKVFKKCSACHVVNKGGENKIGPVLYGVLGRKSGAISDYKYSKALIAHGKVWSYEEMNGYLLKPAAHIKGTKMAFAGLKKEKDRASVILYMNTQSDSPLPKP